METIIITFFVKFLKSGNFKSFLIRFRIAFGSQYHTYRGVIFKLQIHLIQCSVNTCVYHIHNVIFHTAKHYLCLRISEACVKFQHSGTVGSKHQAKENYTFKFPAFCRHSIHRSLINVLSTELIHLFRIERTGRKGTHSTGIQALITVLGPLVILCGSHSFYRLSVYKR